MEKQGIFENDVIVFYNLIPYIGPITLDLVPYGTIRSINYQYIIYLVEGYFILSLVKYKNFCLDFTNYVLLYPQIMQIGAVKVE